VTDACREEEPEHDAWTDMDTDHSAACFRPLEDPTTGEPARLGEAPDD
jgi:hypothetical protein